MRFIPILFRRMRIEAEIDEELRSHIVHRADDLERCGLPRAAAERQARVEFGRGQTFQEECREARGLARLENAAQDARRALRRLRAAPGFTVLAVGSLAFGIAAAAAMFSVSDAVLLRPLPGVAKGEQLAHLERVENGNLLGDFSYPDFLDYRAMNKSFSSLAAFSLTMGGSEIATPGGALQANMELVSPGYFGTLGVTAELGRLLVEGDQQAAVLSDAFWRDRYGADRGVVGRSLDVNSVPVTIVGVAAPGFYGATLNWSTDLWVPITTQPLLHPMHMDCQHNRGCGWVTIFGRLAPGISFARAQAEVKTMAARIGAAHPLYRGRQAELVAGLGSWSDDRAALGHLLGLLLGGTLLLVAMTSASLGSLFLARMGARQHEVATQLALGASRGRVAQQFLLEGGLIAAAGTGLGLAGAPALGRWLLEMAPSAPRNLATGMDGHLLAFAAAVAAASTLAMAAVPAAIAARSSIRPVLQQGGPTATGARRTAQFWMLAAEVGLSFVLLVAAGLAARSLRAATAGQVPAGAGHIMLGSVDTGWRGYTDTQAASFFSRLLPRVETQPGVAAATLAACVPPAPCGRESVFAAGTEPPPGVLMGREFFQPVRPEINSVGPGFFRMLGIPLLAGRGFSAADRADSPLVCVVSQRLAQALWPHESALGRQLAWPDFTWPGSSPRGAHDFLVVGVTADRRTRSLFEPAPEALYLPAAQAPIRRTWIVVSSVLPETAVTAGLRRALAGADPELALRDPHTLAAQVRRSVWQPLAIASLAGLFGIFAALMAATGLFGTLVQAVQERRRELGVRLALGASRAALVRLVVRDGLIPTAMGLLLGAGFAAAAVGWIMPWLFGVGPADAPAWMGATAILLGVALGASLGAARRAVGVQPVEALRCD